jgi:methionyl-tRNA formyltransferase
MRVVFMGTPAFAAPTLAALVRNRHSVGLVITQPDRPVGRRHELTPPPIKVQAARHGLGVFQPRRIKAPEALERIAAVGPEAIVVVGYGQIIPQTIIDLPPLGCVNLHASLLPKYRGAAPINWAIAEGETHTGVTTMRIIQQLDAGDILLKRQTEIGPAETAVELSERLASIGADLLIETLAGLAAGTIVPEKQKEAEVSWAPILKREDGEIDWQWPATQIFNRMRGFVPWPGAFTRFRGKRLHIHRGRPLAASSLLPGVVSIDDGELRMGCGEGTALVVAEVQLEGKKRMPAADFLRGHRLEENEILGNMTRGEAQ